MDIQQTASDVRTKLIACRGARVGNLNDIAKATGLSRSWLTQFASETITNPTIDSLQALVNYFESQRERV